MTASTPLLGSDVGHDELTLFGARRGGATRRTALSKPQPGTQRLPDPGERGACDDADDDPGQRAGGRDGTLRTVTTDPATDRHAWSRPDVETVAPGVLRVPLPLPMDALRAVNVYVLSPSDGADDLTLIDGGWAIESSREALTAALAGLGAEVADIRRFLVTHMHRDHYSQAAALRRAEARADHAGPRIALGAGEADSLAMVRNRVRPFDAQLVALTATGATAMRDEIIELVSDPDVFAGEDVRDYADPDEWLVSGQTVRAAGRTLTAFETPGHTVGHLVYSDDDAGLMFAGDHVLPHITPSIGFEPAGRPDALGRYLASLAAVRAQPDRLLLPAHGPVAPSVHARVDELLAHHDQRLAEIERRVAAGGSTAADVAAAMRWTRRETALDDLDLIQRMLAVLETDAHLEVLAAQGRVAREIDGDGVARHRVR